MLFYINSEIYVIIISKFEETFFNCFLPPPQQICLQSATTGVAPRRGSRFSASGRRRGRFYTAECVAGVDGHYVSDRPSNPERGREVTGRWPRCWRTIRVCSHTSCCCITRRCAHDNTMFAAVAGQVAAYAARCAYSQPESWLRYYDATPHTRNISSFHVREEEGGGGRPRAEHAEWKAKSRDRLRHRRLARDIIIAFASRLVVPRRCDLRTSKTNAE